MSIDDPSSVKMPKQCVFKIIKDTNYAVGEVSVKGLKLESSSKIAVSTSLAQDSTLINVVSKIEENQNPYKWDVNPHDLGPNRAAWDVTNPNLLKISSKHSSVKKYLGSEKKPFPYSESPMFKLLLVEILAEKFAEKIQLIFGESYESTYVSAIFEEPKDLFCSEYILLANMSIKKFVLSLW
jgi:hypothetical protein